MRLFIAFTAVSIALTASYSAAEAATSRKKSREMVVKVKPRSYLDAGTSVPPGVYQNYSRGLTPFRPADSIVPTGSPQQRLLPGAFGIAW